MFLLKHYFSKSSHRSPLFKKVQNHNSSCSWPVWTQGSCCWWRRPKGGSQPGRGAMLFPCAAAAEKPALNLPALLYFCRLYSLFAAEIHFAESRVFVYYLNLLKVRFTSCDVLGFRGERLVGWGRLWGQRQGVYWGRWCSGSCAGLLRCCWAWAGTEWQYWQFGDFLVKAEKLEATFSVLSAGKSQTLWPGCLSWNLLALLCEIALCLFSWWFSENETQSVSLLCVLKTTKNPFEFLKWVIPYKCKISVQIPICYKVMQSSSGCIGYKFVPLLLLITPAIV